MTTPSTTAQTSGDEYLGRILDERYRLDQVIGAGAIGKVYAGTQLAVDRKVAIKLLHSSARERELGTERFLREAKAVARLSDPSCLTLFDFGLDEELNCFYMVTEFVDGPTLAEQMAGPALQTDQIYYVLFQVATALAHAHECGILHRDLKPENIMLVRNAQQETGSFESVKVLDFGLARIREEATPTAAAEPSVQSVEQAETLSGEDSQESSRLTRFGELNGTPAYMSPEQCRGDLDLTPACDYYALGILAYELFEGHLPYEADGVATLLAMHLEEPIPPMRRGNIPSEVEDMIYRLLGKNPDFRLQSSEEVLHILRAQMSLERAQDLALTSLERFRMPTPESDVAVGDEVALAGAETLVNLNPLATPIPGTQTIPEEETMAPAKERPNWVRIGVVLVIVVVALVALTIWGVASMLGGGDKEVSLDEVVEAQAPDKEEEQSGGAMADEAPRRGAAALAPDAMDAGGDQDTRDGQSEKSTDAASGDANQSSSKPAPSPSKPAKPRPRKLELTY